MIAADKASAIRCVRLYAGALSTQKAFSPPELSLKDDDQAKRRCRADQPRGRLVPCLDGIRFDAGDVFVHFIRDVQIRAPAKK
jgi:hypothetical protein